MTGWRIGYMGGPEEIIRAAAKVQGQVTNTANSIAQKATIAALAGSTGTHRGDDGRNSERRRDYVAERCSALRRRPSRSPDGAMFFFFNVEGYFGGASPAGIDPESRVDLVTHLLERHHVALVPGDGFGDPRLRAALVRLLDDANWRREWTGSYAG